jgi:hypothetical protein
MKYDSTLYVGLDVHKDSIAVAYAIGMNDVETLGSITTTQKAVDQLCKRLQSKARHVCVAYEAGPCGYALYLSNFISHRSSPRQSGCCIGSVFWDRLARQRTHGLTIRIIVGTIPSSIAPVRGPS